MQRQEIPNNTAEQVEQYVRDALALVEKIAPPDELREAVFTQAVSLISGKQIVMIQPQPVALPAMAIPRNRH